jgi:hypothetical protein
MPRPLTTRRRLLASAAAMAMAALVVPSSALGLDGHVALAHHRGLRQPNADRFDVLLDRVAEITTDPTLADRARRYKAGL